MSSATHRGHRHPLCFILEKRRQSACLAWSLQHVRNADPSLLDLLASSSTSLTVLHTPGFFPTSAERGLLWPSATSTTSPGVSEHSSSLNLSDGKLTHRASLLSTCPRLPALYSGLLGAVLMAAATVPHCGPAGPWEKAIQRKESASFVRGEGTPGFTQEENGLSRDSGSLVFSSCSLHGDVFLPLPSCGLQLR